MANNNPTISIGWKIEDAAGGLKQVTMSAEDLRKVMRMNVVESEKLSSKFINLAAVCTSMDSLSSTFDSLKTVLDGLAGAYDVQAEAETRLEQVMRNTMDATDEQIQNIKDFCSAQQQIGVVGDEVQLAGAQELATYLELKSSLQSLIPVMNDMLVQQNGLSSTGEQAAQIASMLGKVMEGQTGALSRYGYKFDEAQEKILKYGTETEKAAVLVDVISESVGGMNQALALTDSGKIEQLKNRLGDMKETLGGLVKRAQPVLIIGANATVALGGVMKLIKGLQTLNTTLKLTKAAAGWISLALTAVTTAVIWFMNRTDDAVDSLDRLKNAEERAAEASQKLADVEQTANDARKAAASSIELNIAKLKNFNGTKAEEEKLVKEMNATYGEKMGCFKSVSKWYDALIKNSKAYCDQMVAEAKARKYADQIADLEIKRDQIAYDDKGNLRGYSNKREQEYRYITDEEAKELRAKGERVDGQHVSGRYVQSAWMDKKGSSPREKAQEAYDDYTEQLHALKKRVESETKKIKMPVMGEVAPVEDTFKPVNPVNPATKIPEKEKAREGSIQYVKDQISDIDNKVKFSIDPEEIYNLERQKACPP